MPRAIRTSKANVPSAKLWPDRVGTWLVVRAFPIREVGPQALLLIAVPLGGPRVFAWAYWYGQGQATWIGPRHTNFNEGSICAFPLQSNHLDCEWPLTRYLDLLSEWCARHLYLAVHEKWQALRRTLDLIPSQRNAAWRVLPALRRTSDVRNVLQAARRSRRLGRSKSDRMGWLPKATAHRLLNFARSQNAAAVTRRRWRLSFNRLAITPARRPPPGWAAALSSFGVFAIRRLAVPVERSPAPAPRPRREDRHRWPPEPPCPPRPVARAGRRMRALEPLLDRQRGVVRARSLACGLDVAARRGVGASRGPGRRGFGDRLDAGAAMAAGAAAKAKAVTGARADAGSTTGGTNAGSAGAGSPGAGEPARPEQRTGSAASASWRLAAASSSSFRRVRRRMASPLPIRASSARPAPPAIGSMSLDRIDESCAGGVVTAGAATAQAAERPARRRPEPARHQWARRSRPMQRVVQQRQARRQPPARPEPRPWPGAPRSRCDASLSIWSTSSW